MSELKIIIWVILGIIYLVSRSRKKQPVAGTPPRTETPTEHEPVTFEELLREIQASKSPPPTVAPVPAVLDSKRAWERSEEAQSLEEVNVNNRNDDDIYETYEKARREAFLRPSMEETMKLEDTVVRFGQFKGYERQEKSSLAAAYAADLRNPADFKKAFILSEILNRRF